MFCIQGGPFSGCRVTPLSHKNQSMPHNDEYKEPTRDDLDDEERNLSTMMMNANPLGLVRSGAVLVQRSKSYVRPENKVLPIEFPKRPLRQTNLLKTEGAKRTWRAVNPSRSHTTLAAANTIMQDAAVDSNRVSANEPCKTQNRQSNQNQQSSLVYRVDQVKPSVIKSLIDQQQTTKQLTKQIDQDATSNDEFTDFDDSHVAGATRARKSSPLKAAGSAWTLSNSNNFSSTSSSATSSASSTSVDKLKNVRNEINNYRDKYSRSMGNIPNDGWHCDEIDLCKRDNNVSTHSSQHLFIGNIFLYISDRLFDNYDKNLYFQFHSNYTLLLD